MSFSKGGKGSGRGKGDTNSTISINQTAHGFTVTQAVYLDDGDGLYKLAKADVLATANAIGIVTGVSDVNNFQLTSAGAKNIFTGLTEGKTFYVSASVAGNLTETQPTISRPILNAISPTEGFIFIDAVSVSGSVGGDDTEVLWNNNGVVDGDPSFTFDETTKLVTMEDVVIENDLTVRGTTISVNSESVNIADNHIFLNAGNTLLSNESGGMVVNTGVIGSAFNVAGAFVPGIASTSNPNVTLTGASFATNDIVEVSGTLHNDGVYEVLTFAANVLTVRGVGNTATVEKFTNNQFQTESAVGQVVKINATVLITNAESKRIWAEATGSTTSIANPFIFDYFNEGNLPYVVGKSGGATPYKYNTIQSAIDAVEASGSTDNIIVVTPGLYVEDLAISSDALAITSLTNENEITLISGDMTITANAPLTTSTISIDGFLIFGSITTAGSVILDIKIGHTAINNNAAGNTIDLGNTNTGSVIRGTSLNVQQSFSGNAIQRTAGSTSLFFKDCVIFGTVDFSGIDGGEFNTENTAFTNQIDLSSSTVESLFLNPIIVTPGSTPCLNLTSSGACVMVGGLLDVTAGGNAITPATGANFTFSNVSTVSGTILTTATGTRFTTDGVDLESDGTGGANYLDDSGGYSVPATIFNSNGDVSSTRVINGPQGRMISFNTFDVDNFGNSNEEGFFQAISSRVALGHLALDGAGGITGVMTLIIDPAVGMLITETVNSRGLQYAADYSANFVVRSLVDKAYADNPDSMTVGSFFELSRQTSATDLTSTGLSILAITDSSSPRSVFLAPAELSVGRQFVVKDEGGQAGTNAITVSSPNVSVISAVAGGGGTIFTTSAAHNLVNGTVIFNSGFGIGTYNGIQIITAIPTTTSFTVAALTFIFTDTGTTNIAIDGVGSVQLTADFASLGIYSTSAQFFTTLV